MKPAPAAVDAAPHVGVAAGVLHMLGGGIVLAAGAWPFAGNGLPPALWLLWGGWGAAYAGLRGARREWWFGRWPAASFVFVWVYALLAALAGLGLAL